MRLLTIGFAALVFAGSAAAHTVVSIGTAKVPRFWLRVAQCETGSRWDWGKYADSPQRRPGEGTTFEGGLGFYSGTWTMWRTQLHVGYRYAWQAPPLVQVRVAAWGLVHGGYWGCLHDGSVDPSQAPSYASVERVAQPPVLPAVRRVAALLESI